MNVFTFNNGAVYSWRDICFRRVAHSTRSRPMPLPNGEYVFRVVFGNMCLLSFSLSVYLSSCVSANCTTSLDIKCKVKWELQCFENSSLHKAIYSVANRNQSHMVLDAHFLPRFSPPHHFFCLRVKQKYGSEFEIKRKTDSWIMWPERNVDAAGREKWREQQQTVELANWIATLWQDIHFHTFKKWLATCKFQDWASNDMIFSLLSCCVCVSVCLFFLEHRISETFGFRASTYSSGQITFYWKCERSSSLPFNWITEQQRWRRQTDAVDWFKVNVDIYLVTNRGPSIQMDESSLYLALCCKFNIYELPFYAGKIYHWKRVNESNWVIDGTTQGFLGISTKV